ncbi:TM2 domain-containing protein [Adhaeribacter arboris]|nr:TM2 domain-containing protein [Adhaeribacter arboris]
MKIKFLLANLIVVLLLSACARETYYFPKVGDPYGSYHKKATPAPATTPDKVITAEEMVTEPTPVNEVALTASVNKIAVAPVKSDVTAIKSVSTVKKAKISKIAEIKAALKVKKQIKAVVKAAEKKEKAANPAEAASGKSQLVAAVLAFVVGYVGIHRFYLGYTGIGIAQVLTLGGCGIWALIDLIRILMGDLKPKDGDYTEKLDF